MTHPEHIAQGGDTAPRPRWLPQSAPRRRAGDLNCAAGVLLGVVISLLIWLVAVALLLH